MGFFDLFKKEEQKRVAWRNAEGKIECNGESCTDGCDWTCPIWVHSEGISHYKGGRMEDALECFKKAVEIAPDFKDSWVNMGGIYGGRSEYAEAYKCYKKAYEIDQNYKNAIFGLIMSSRDMGNYDEAFAYCDEYAKKIDASEARRLRGKVEERIEVDKVEAQKASENAELSSTGNPVKAVDIVMEFIKLSRVMGLLQNLPEDHFPHIPELIVQSEKVCNDVLKDMVSHKEDPHCMNPVIWINWAIYAGIGAVWHWNEDWDSLKENGIFQTLCEPRGSFYMDEYVMDCVGKKFDSDEEKELRNVLYSISQFGYVKYASEVEKKNMVPAILETMKAGYMWGMVYQMNELGMR